MGGIPITLKIAEVNLTNLAVVLFVGAGGILSVYVRNENIAIACFSGLVGYLARGYANRENNDTQNTEEITTRECTNLQDNNEDSWEETEDVQPDEENQ